MLSTMSPQTTQEQVSQMFNEISPSYDRVNRILSLGLDAKWRKKMIDHLPKGDNLHLLDLATGTCDQLIPLMHTGKIASATGLDLAEELLKIGRQKIEKLPFKDRVALTCSNALDIPAEDHSFDCVTMTFGVRNVQGNCLGEIFRVLKKGGRVLILEFSLPKNRLCKRLHLFYLRTLLPLIGGWLSKNRSAYTYLSQTIENFPYGEAFVSLMQQEGFVQVKALPLTFGAVTLYVGEKP